MSRGESTRRHYRALLESEQTEGQHPADRLVADLPDVREIDEGARASPTPIIERTPRFASLMPADRGPSRPGCDADDLRSIGFFDELRRNFRIADE